MKSRYRFLCKGCDWAIVAERETGHKSANKHERATNHQVIMRSTK